jgi:hypothetical protein
MRVTSLHLYTALLMPPRTNVEFATQTLWSEARRAWTPLFVAHVKQETLDWAVRT